MDVDPKNGGTASLAKLTADYELPATRTHHTASGPDSLHFIYRADPTRPLKPKPLDPSRYPGIDIKTGRGSLIVAPGSVIGGKRYEVVSGCEPVVAPSWLSEIQQAAPPAIPAARFRTPSVASAGHPGGTSLAALRALPPDHLGRDNSWLCQVAGKLARKHRNDFDAYLRDLFAAVHRLGPCRKAVRPPEAQPGDPLGGHRPSGGRCGNYVMDGADCGHEDLDDCAEECFEHYGDSAAQFQGVSALRTMACDDVVTLAACPADCRCSAGLRSRVNTACDARRHPPTAAASRLLPAAPRMKPVGPARTDPDRP